MQKAFAVLAGPLVTVWLFLVVTTPLVAVILMLTAMAWQDHRTAEGHSVRPGNRARFLRANR